MSRQYVPTNVRCAVARAAGAVEDSEIVAHCTYCGRRGLIQWRAGARPVFRGLHLDHYHPESRGGEATAENIVLACQECNLFKGDRLTGDDMLDMLETGTWPASAR